MASPVGHWRSKKPIPNVDAAARWKGSEAASSSQVRYAGGSCGSRESILVSANPTPLLKTPLPYSDESPAGYLLRLANTNGYSGTRAILSLLGFRPGYVLTMGWDYSALENLLGGKELPPRFGYRHGSGARGKVKVLGELVAAEHVGVKRARVCAACLSTLGYIPGVWDLKAYAACHIHKSMMIKFCAGCGERIKVFRKNIFYCECGADLREQKPAPAPEVLIALSEILASKVGSARTINYANSLKFPVRDLLAMDLDVICKAIVQLAFVYLSLELGARPVFKSADVSRCLPAVATAFSNWPSNFSVLCSKWQHFCERRGRCPPVFQVCFGWIFVNLHKNLRRQAKQSIFIVRAALVYGLETWNKSPVKVRSAICEKLSLPEPRFVAPDYAAKTLGIRGSLIHDWIKKKKVTASKYGSRYLLDMNELREIKISRWRDLHARDAAVVLGVSSATFSALRKKGLIAKSFRTSCPNATSKEDLDDFVSRVVERAKIAPPRRRLPRLSTWLMGRFPVEAKVRLFALILSGRVEIYRRESAAGRASFRDLLIERDSIDAEFNKFNKSNTQLSVAECCDRFGVRKIEAIGAVNAVCGMAESRGLRRASAVQMDKFFKENVPLRTLVPYVQGTCKNIQTALAQNGLEAAVMSVVVGRKNGRNQMVHFASRRHAARVKAVITKAIFRS